MSSNNIKIPEVMTQLPAFYWLPKMHKTLTGSRFIAASSGCTAKPLSQLLTNCLNLIIQHYKEYNEGILKNSGANCFWIIDNSTQVLNKLAKLNNSTTAKHFDSFDFSTLYTNIPHDLLLNCLDNLDKEAYRVRGATYISTGYSNTFWSDKISTGYTRMTVDKLIEYINFLIYIIHIRAGNKVFKQAVGIPMGTDCAPLLAKYKYVKDKLKESHRDAVLFRPTMRYIDDLLTINTPTSEQEIPKIYPPQLTLKKTTETPEKLLYVDICLQIQGRKFKTSVYDRRDAFDFHMVNFPHLDCNIPSKPACEVYMSQLVRIGRICNKYEGLKDRHHMLTTRLLKQGYKYDCLHSTFKKSSINIPPNTKTTCQRRDSTTIECCK